MGWLHNTFSKMEKTVQHDVHAVSSEAQKIGRAYIHDVENVARLYMKYNPLTLMYEADMQGAQILYKLALKHTPSKVLFHHLIKNASTGKIEFDVKNVGKEFLK